jgi:magnesium chelatase family protein
MLRQPLEDRSVTLARTNMTLSFPASFILICALNPCPCGFYGDTTRECRCTGAIIQRYMSKLSGPLLDRIDLHIDVPAVAASDLALPPPAESSADIAERVLIARKRQTARYTALPDERRVRTNAEADGALLDEVATPEEAGRTLLTRAAERLRLSARGYHRVLRVARTLADLDGAAIVARRHVAEALSYRRGFDLPEGTGG